MPPPLGEDTERLFRGIRYATIPLRAHQSVRVGGAQVSSAVVVNVCNAITVRNGSVSHALILIDPLIEFSFAIQNFLLFWPFYVLIVKMFCFLVMLQHLPLSLLLRFLSLKNLNALVNWSPIRCMKR